MISRRITLIPITPMPVSLIGNGFNRFLGTMGFSLEDPSRDPAVGPFVMTSPIEADLGTVLDVITYALGEENLNTRFLFMEEWGFRLPGTHDARICKTKQGIVSYGGYRFYSKYEIEFRETVEGILKENDYHVDGGLLSQFGIEIPQ